MKKIILSFAVILFSTICCLAQQKYVINGTIEDYAHRGRDIKLYSLSSGELLGETKIVEGQFRFEGEVPTEDIGRLISGETIVDIVLEEGDISVLFDRRVLVSGSKHNDILNEMYMKKKGVIKKIEREEKFSDIRYSDADIIYWLENGLFFQININKIYNDLIKENPNSILEAYIYAIGTKLEHSPIRKKSAADLKQVSARNPYMKNFNSVNSRIELLERAQATSVGRKYIDIVGRDMADTKEVKLSDFLGKGKMVLVNFWTSNCGECMAEAMYIRNFNKIINDEIIVVGINVNDNFENARKDLKLTKSTWNHIHTQGTKALEAYGHDDAHTSILLNSEGTILQRGLKSEQMAKYLNKIASDN